MMLFMAILFMYVAGVIKAFMMMSGAMFKRHPHLIDVAKSINKTKARWIYDFEDEWETVNAQRNELYYRAIASSLTSWVAVVGLMISGDDKYPPQLTLPTMPDKKEFKAIVDKLAEAESLKVVKPRVRKVKLSL